VEFPVCFRVHANEFNEYMRSKLNQAMKTSYRALAAVVLGLVIPAVQAQNAPPNRAGSAAPLDPTTQVITAFADALGCVTHAGFGGGAKNQRVKAFLFIANGTMSEPASAGSWTEYKVSKLQAEFSFYPYSQGVSRSPGVRWSIDRTGPDGKAEHVVHVAALGNPDDPQSVVGWNQASVTAAATPVSAATAADRLFQAWLMPNGLVWAALTKDGGKAKEGVQVSNKDGKTVLTIPAAGTSLIATLNADKFPEHVEARIKNPALGETLLTVDYSGYRDFEQAYYVMFPEHIVEKIAGHTLLDLTVTEAHTNPYVVFPLPAEVASAKGN
jgi:hypothetical protein